MISDSKMLLDETGKVLLHLLQENARLSYNELGKRVGLSAPGVAHRIQRMEEAGIITGYRAEVSAEKLGLPITAFIRVRPVGERASSVAECIRPCFEVHEGYHVAGGDCYILKVMVTSISQLEELIERFTPLGDITTSIVLSSLIIRKEFFPETDEKERP